MVGSVMLCYVMLRYVFVCLFKKLYDYKEVGMCVAVSQYTVVSTVLYGKEIIRICSCC